MPISMNSPSASIVATPAGADCSSSASCSTRSLRHPLDIGLHALALKHKTTTCSGHCTQAATPLSENMSINGIHLNCYINDNPETGRVEIAEPLPPGSLD